MNKFICGMCGGEFWDNTPEEEKQKEMLELFGPVLATSGDEQVPVCDDCFNRYHPSKYPDVLEISKQKAINKNKN